jgi:CubicO group peptidase (beta-lactamase class C family)
MRKFTALVFIITGCAQAPTFEKEVDDIFSYLNGNTPGGAVLILKNDSVVFSHAYGLADLPSKEKITTQTLFNTGSISKTFVAYVILELAQEGKLSLNDSIARFFPEFKKSAASTKSSRASFAYAYFRFARQPQATFG